MGILLRSQNDLEVGKITNTYGYKKNKVILNKLNNSLPELMARNKILGERLKNKIKVSSFMNNSENKNKKYFNYFIISSGKRVKDSKTGLGLKRVMKKGTDNLTRICKHINNDIIINNKDFILGEKKLIGENTELETHNKINELVKEVKQIIKPTNIHEDPVSGKRDKSLSEEELYKMNNIIYNELNNDENKLKNKIDYYLKNLNNIAETKPKQFHKIAHNICLDSNLKMLDYIKPKLIPIKDSESANMLRIRRHLIRSISNIDKKNLKNKENKDNNYNDYEKMNIRNYMNKRLTNSMTRNNDTLNILKNLSSQNNYLGNKANRNLKKINSMIDIKLPYYSNYYRTIKYIDNSKKDKNISNNNSMDNLYYKNIIESGLKRENSLDEIQLIKKELNKITHAKILRDCRNIEKQKNSTIF